MTSFQQTYRPALVRFTHADLYAALRREANRGPQYVRLQAQRLLNRYLGATPRNWAPRAPRLPELTLTPGQRVQFHFHPLPLAPELAPTVPQNTLTPEAEESEQPDDPL